jgi:excisionase family DNA binding protein
VKNKAAADDGFPDLNELITPTQAARIRGVTRAAITSLIKRQRLRAIEIGGRPFVRRSDVENFAPEKPGPKAQAA